MKIVFLGTSKFSKFYLDALVQAGHEVGTNLNKFSPDLGVIAYYGKILPGETLKIPKMGFINVHHSLLPRWRGPSPIQAAILAGDIETGVTISLVTLKVDAGDIIAQEKIAIGPGDTYLDLEKKLCEIGAPLLTKTVELIAKGKMATQPQDNSKATYSKIIKTQDGQIDWSRNTEEILRKVRALNPNPGTFTFFNAKRLIVSEAETQKKNHELSPGTVMKEGSSFKIATPDGFLIPKRVKLEGRKELAAEDFFSGRKEIIGAILS